MRAQKASVFVEIAVEERLVDFYAVFFVRSSRTFVCGFVQNPVKQAQICDLCPFGHLRGHGHFW